MRCESVDPSHIMKRCINMNHTPKTGTFDVTTSLLLAPGLKHTIHFFFKEASFKYKTSDATADLSAPSMS